MNFFSVKLLDLNASKPLAEFEPSARTVQFCAVLDHVFHTFQVRSKKLASMDSKEVLLILPLVCDVDDVIRCDRGEEQQPFGNVRLLRGDFRGVARSPVILVAGARRIVAVKGEDVLRLELLDFVADLGNHLVVRMKESIGIAQKLQRLGVPRLGRISSFLPSNHTILGRIGEEEVVALIAVRTDNLVQVGARLCKL